MEEITVYVAADGTRFDDKEECHKYELMHKMKKHPTLKMWAIVKGEYVLLPLSSESCRDATLCLIEDDNAFEMVNLFSERTAYEMPYGIGMWYWSDFSGGSWIEYNEITAALRAFDFMRQDREKVNES